MAGLRRRRRQQPPRRWTPEVTTLEGRTLQVVNGSLGFLHVDPQILAPTGQYVTVKVTGEIGANHMNPPSAYFFVTDEYRLDEPHGVGIPLTFSQTKGIWDIFTYSFTIQLQAKRSTRTPDGRHYDLFVGAKDNDGTDGLTTQIFVPKVFPPHPTAAPKPHAHARHGR